jgi:hypothetical protein
LLSSRWIPAKYREAQNDFFGKRGVTWHITVISRKKKQDSNGINMTNDIQERDDGTISDQEQAFIDNEEEEKSESYHNSETSKITYIIY